MEKEIIAIDADDVLANTVPIFIEWMNKEYQTNFSYEKMNNQDYDLDYLKIDKKDWRNILDKFHSSKEYKKIMPVKGAIKAILKIKEKYKLVIITSRPETLNSVTEKFLEEHFPKIFSEIHHTTILKENKSIKKSEVCKKIGAKTIIEDSYKNAIDCAEQGIKAIILDMPWNRNKNYSHKNMTYTKNWEEITKILIPNL